MQQCTAAYVCTNMVFVFEIGPDPHTCRLAPQLAQMAQQLIASTETKAPGKLQAAASNSLQIIDTQACRLRIHT